jgi:5-methylthioribose kinase
MSTIVMELLSPHIILRKGLIAGVKYPRLARDVGVFLGRTLFLSSDLALSSAAKKAKVAVFCGNTAMCDLSHDVIFTDPYAGSQHNHHTTPQLDDVASALLGDAEAKVAVSQLKARFMTDTQALLHGDLHTGSVMVTESQTRVIDPEFGFYGPMGFDIGAYVANLLLAYFAHHARGLADAAGYRKWLLGQIVETWEVFQETFEALWTGGSHKGDVYSPKFFAGDERAFAHARHAYMASILRDTAQFAGAKMIRRIVGVAHVEDLSGIADADARARCERAAVSLGRSLLVNPDRIARIQDIVVQAEKAAEGL